MDKKLDKAMNFTKEELSKYFLRVRGVCSNLEYENIKGIYTNIFFTIFYHDIETIPCFGKIKTEKVKGMDLSAVEKFHRFRIEKILDKYKEVISTRGRESDRIIIETDLLYNELKSILVELGKLTKGFTLKEMVELHRVIIRTIVSSHLDEDNNKELINDIENNFIKLFGKHYGFLGCGIKE